MTQIIKKNWTKNEVNFLINNYEENGMNYCSNILNRTKDIVRYKAYKLGLKYKHGLKKYSDKEIDFLRRNAYKYNLEDLSKTINRSKESLGIKLRNLNIPIQKTKASVNCDFFKTWSHDMAYILGFLHADGCVFTGKSNRKSVTCGVQKEDKAILEYILKHIAPNQKINHFKQKNKSGKMTNGVKFIVYNDILYDSLIDLNFRERKTYNKILPPLPQKFKFE